MVSDPCRIPIFSLSLSFPQQTPLTSTFKPLPNLSSYGAANLSSVCQKMNRTCNRSLVLALRRLMIWPSVSSTSKLKQETGKKHTWKKVWRKEYKNTDLWLVDNSVTILDTKSRVFLPSLSSLVNARGNISVFSSLNSIRTLPIPRLFLRKGISLYSPVRQKTREGRSIDLVNLSGKS